MSYSESNVIRRSINFLSFQIFCMSAINFTNFIVFLQRTDKLLVDGGSYLLNNQGST